MLKYVISLALLLPQLVLATAYTATGGDWSSSASWGGAGVPGNNDTATIPLGVAISLTDERIIGNSPAAGNVVLAISGSLTIATGGYLHVRGDIQYVAVDANDVTPWTSVQHGGIFEWDSSLNPTQQYSSYPSANNNFREFNATGTVDDLAVIRSNAGGAVGYFSLGGHSFGGRYILLYASSTKIGDATHAAYSQETAVTNGGAQWDAQHVAFTSNGLAPDAQCSLQSNDVFRHDFNVHVDSKGPSVFTRPDSCDSIAAIGASGVRDITANVFDKIADTQLDPRDFTITDNYFTGVTEGITIQKAIFHIWTLWRNNFYTVTTGSSTFLQLAGPTLDSVFLLEEPNTINPHGVLPGGVAGHSISGNIIAHTGQLTSSRSSFIITNIQLANELYTVDNNIMLPNGAMGMTWWLSGVFSFGQTPTFEFDNNTAVVTGSDNGAFIVTNHNPDVTNTGEIKVRNNLLWNPAGSVEGYKLFAETASGVDPCAPGDCDYNNGFNMLTDGGGYTNGGNGYAATFSSVPGQHDLSVDPKFYDSTRNIATFDSAYLNNHPAAWSLAASYSVGDMVSSSDASVFNGATINYRWVNNAGCSGNTKPGVFSTAAFACWELATKFRIREAIAAQTLYDDQITGIHGGDIIQALVAWIRQGYSPTNSTLALAGYNGQDIGAVPWTMAAPTFTETVAPILKNSLVKGTIVK